MITIHWRCDFFIVDLLPVIRLIQEEGCWALEIGWLCFGAAVAFEGGSQ